MKNRVSVKIMDSTYTILADESEEYVLKIAKDIDTKMREILQANEHASLTMAAVLTSFNYCDEANKTVENTNNLRAQIREYSEDVAKYRNEAEDARRQVIRLQNEVSELRARLSKYNG